MKRSIVLTLLCALAVVTIFATTSCKSKAIFGGPDIPPKQSTPYVDIGNGWQELSQLPLQEGCPRRPYITDLKLAKNEATLSHIIENYWHVIPRSPVIETEFRESQIRYTYRLSPTEMQLSESATQITSIKLCTVKSLRDLDDSVLPATLVKDCYIIDDNRNISPVDKSDYREGYIYLEFNNLPGSPTGLYVLLIDTQDRDSQLLILKTR